MKNNLGYITSTLSKPPFVAFSGRSNINSSFDDKILYNIDINNLSPKVAVVPLIVGEASTSEIKNTPLTVDERSTSIFENIKRYSEFKRNSSELIEEEYKETRDSLVRKITKQLKAKLINFNYDDDSMETIWNICDNLPSNVSNDILGESLQQIYISCNNYPNILCGICELLTSYELCEVAPWGTMILIGLLNHKNETVKEYAVILLDNWKDKTLIPLLQNLEIHTQWLRDYVNDVLSGLKE